MVSQEFLAAVHSARLARAGVDASADATVAAEADDAYTAVVVLSRFDVAAFATSALRFAIELDPAHRQPWLRAFTRTAFLAGNPVNLRQRFHFAQVSPDESIAWSGPGPTRDFTGLRRLLKVFPAGRLPVATEVPLVVPDDPAGAGRPGSAGHTAELRIATTGLTVASYLVHLNHTLVEAVLTGLLRPGDGLVVRHAPELDDTALHAASTVRVHRDLDDPERLRAYTCLSIPA